MTETRRAIPVLAMLPLALLLAACGSNDETRPIEVLFYVDGLSGTRFAVDGIQAANGDHHLPGRTFEVPYFFVLENAQHFKTGAGIRGCFRTFADETAPITVFLYFGTALQQRVVLQPGQCYGPGYDPQDPPDCDEFVNPCTVTADIDMPEPEVRFEICTHTGDGVCLDSPATGPANVAFSSSIGDFDATNITTCLVPEAAVSACTTPSIFYLEDPADRIQGIFTKLGGQNPDVDLQADLYVGGNLRTSTTEHGDVVIDEDI
jgi:hypothetical protein